MFIDFITKVSHIIAEPNDDFSHRHFELQNFILAQKVTFITPSMFSGLHFCTPFTSMEFHGVVHHLINNNRADNTKYNTKLTIQVV